MRPSPFNPLRPGDPLTAHDVNTIAEAAYRGAQQSAAGTTGITRPAGSPPLVIGVDTPRVYVRITGGGSGCAFSGTSGNPSPPARHLAGPNCYCGIEQTSDSFGNVRDFEDGLIFDSFAFPLVEMSGDTNVPVDALAWASPSRSGTHYEFLWEGDTSGSGESGGSGSGGTGSGNVCGCVQPSDFIQCINGVIYIRPGCLIVNNGRLCFDPF